MFGPSRILNDVTRILGDMKDHLPGILDLTPISSSSKRQTPKRSESRESGNSLDQTLKDDAEKFRRDYAKREILSKVVFRELSISSDFSP